MRRKFEDLLAAGLDEHEWLDSADAILAKAPLLDRHQIEGWKGIWTSRGGWLAAAKSINAVGEELQRAGVRLAFGGAGAFKAPILKDGVCVGVQTADGSEYFADKVVLATGAWTPTLIDLEGQCCSKAWVYGHLQLSPAEAEEYKGHPVVYNGDVGFFFEPNEQGLIKVCDEFPGFTRFKDHMPFGGQSQRISVPRSHAKHPTDTVPHASDKTLRQAVATYLPRFGKRPLLNRALCWCTDTADANLLICEHPRWRNLVVASGDSGHTFKLHPVIGLHVVELLEGRLASQLVDAWKWRPGGDPVKSIRPGYPQDLADMPGWRNDGAGKL
jgi:sarcosine oxidase/L-pipecolate oxidase